MSDLLTRLERTGSVAAFDAPVTDIEPRWVAAVSRVDRAEPRAVVERDVWFSGGGFDDRLRLRTEGSLRRADGAPVPPGPQDRAGWDTEHYDVSYVRGWTETLGQTGSGLDVTLTPHVGVGVGSRGNSTEAGATLRIGRNLDRLVPEGSEAFGERPRWYVYAAGSGRAVGYNFARTRDGDYARSGVSHDSGNFLGDASIGVAMRKGAVQGSVGLVYREIETEGLRAGNGIDTDVSEGVIAFQLSIKPD
ncbi:lipid A-modifier LpxR family protein [uncultured Brevundimonas sp.]|uniref:lipid A-modifier LpxR family protein n=1 Tax=uncultured Brevundimonas sp. TaxID=213418 RepID=UPI0025EB20CF|nr:lipid A-modifier LpxR family protein [uncultured Brevundimonas sp.]